MPQNRWINELAKYNFSLEYQKGKNNTMADTLSRISEECLSDEEAEKVLEAVPVIPGQSLQREGRRLVTREGCPHTMSSETMKPVFDNLTLGAGRRAELEYSTDSAPHHEADSIKVSV